MAESEVTQFKDKLSGMRCKFYENRFPAPEEVLMVNASQVGETIAHDTLLEHGDSEAIAQVPKEENESAATIQPVATRQVITRGELRLKLRKDGFSDEMISWMLDGLDLEAREEQGDEQKDPEEEEGLVVDARSAI